MKIIVTGATGLVGAEVLRQAIADPDIEQITALVRRPLTVQHAKIRTVLHENFNDYSSLETVFLHNDVCIWCLGISQSQVKKAKYQEITYNYTIAAAEKMIAVNPNIGFIFLSGDGADQNGKAKTLFGQTKGMAEKKLLQLPFKLFYIARPGAIRPINKNPRAPFLYKLLNPLFPLMELFTPSKVINSVQVAKALLQLAKKGNEQVIVENMTLKSLAAAT